jgi:2-methylcitrate dehydratase PrpD
MNRRKFLSTSALAGGAAAAAVPLSEEATVEARDVTRKLVRYIVSARREDVPVAVRKEATRTLLNWVGCAVGGSRHETVDNAIAALAPFSGPAQATVLGRKERLDVLNASLMNEISSHVFDFDDTDLRTIVHPAGAVASAILALSEYRPVSGADFLHALILGAEAECRIANTVYPAHYDVGWHITGTVGPFGAAAAVGKLLDLSETQMLWALGLAATQPVGLREMFGTMTKSFHLGRAAQNGFTAALLAQRNFTSSTQAIEAARGWANVLSTARHYTEITESLGSRFEISVNSYKPFPCGVVIHPAIDGCLQLRGGERIEIGPDRAHRSESPPARAGVERKEDATSRTGGQVQRIPRGGGGNGVWACERKRIQRPCRAESGDSGVARTSHYDRRPHDSRGPGADRGSAEGWTEAGEIRRARSGNPMTDSQLEGKFAGLAEGVLPRERVQRLMDLCWEIEQRPQAADLARVAAAV